MKLLDFEIEALRATIDRWWRIANGGRYGRCPLCDISDIECSNCIVSRESGMPLCKNTPYMAWVGYFNNRLDVIEFVVCDEETQLLALDVYQYAVSLLPEGRRDE